eukprot:351375-Chlamydomonas_euryale.AAC.1
MRVQTKRAPTSVGHERKPTFRPPGCGGKSDITLTASLPPAVWAVVQCHVAMSGSNQGPSGRCRVVLDVSDVYDSHQLCV